MYRFFYSYHGEIYGVLKHKREEGILLVELVRTGEREEIEGNWLLEQLESKNADIAHNAHYINVYEEEELSKYLPTSS